MNIIWVFNDLLVTLLPRLGGMHTLMNILGVIGTLMIKIGLQDIREAVFGRVIKMLSGK